MALRVAVSSANSASEHVVGHYLYVLISHSAPEHV